MLISNGGGIGEGLLGGETSSEPASDDPNLAFGAAVAQANTKAPRVSATHIGNLHRTIAQGRIIQAVTESAINTELPAPIRAIVSRDVFAEAGTTPLIPKGSRLIGQYNTDLLGGQSRVYLVWTRVIRPDGVDVLINSPLVDRIGQAGIGGQVDSKFQQIFSRAVLASVVTISLALASDEVTGGGQTSTTNSAIGGTTQSGDGATTATVNALNRLGSTTDSFLQRYMNLRPSILVDQGTPVNVFVNRDLVFPAEFNGVRVVP
jgi:type IV secretion system protein VirB10